MTRVKSQLMSPLDIQGLNIDGFRSITADTLLGFYENALCAYYLPFLDDCIDDCTAVCSSYYSLFCL